MRIAVIGAGAAGCFCAIEIRRKNPGAEVCVYEAGNKPLAKVAVTGGGRCNITNTFKDISQLKEAYPRGTQLMRRALARFGWQDTLRWFEAEGVRFTIQEDGCVFPASQDAMQIVRTLLSAMQASGVRLLCRKRVDRLHAEPEGGFRMEFSDGTQESADRVVFTPGGCSRGSLERILPPEIPVTDTVPSLFTLRIEDSNLHSLMGTVVDNAILSLAGTGIKSCGTLLLTDWGISGPATLKLSSYAARQLARDGYNAVISINWTGMNEGQVRKMLEETGASNPSKFISSTHPEGITGRLWKHLLGRTGARDGLRWQELGSKGMNRLVSTLVSDCYKVTGRAKFKEEFVTCGGVDLAGVDINTLESKRYPGLFFAGEVLDIDAITGGFNLQAAWSTGMTVSEF